MVTLVLVNLLLPTTKQDLFRRTRVFIFIQSLYIEVVIYISFCIFLNLKTCAYPWLLKGMRVWQELFSYFLWINKWIFRLIRGMLGNQSKNHWRKGSVLDPISSWCIIVFQPGSSFLNIFFIIYVTQEVNGLTLMW